MSDPHHAPDHSKSDDELLAEAIPIEGLDDEEATPVIDHQHSPPAEADGIELVSEGEMKKSSIRSSYKAIRHEDKWTRKPNSPGTGAIHVRTFVCKLRLDAVEHLDQQVNEWLDQHPQYEVKFVTATVGELVGKMKEPALFLNVWV